MDEHLYSIRIVRLPRKQLEKRFNEIIVFLDKRIKENKPLLPKPNDEKIRLYDLRFPKIGTFYFDISHALLKEARNLSKKIRIPGCGDSKTIAVTILCAVSIEATLNYIIRFCMHLMGFKESEVYQLLCQVPITLKIKIVEKYFKDDADYRHAFKFLYGRVKEGVEDWAYVGLNRNRLMHHKGDVVHMSISQAQSLVKITEKIVNKFSSEEK